MRDNLARQIAITTQEVGTVTGLAGRSVRVRSALGEFDARRAASCLLEPALGDEVLVAHHERGAHVLAILERDAAEPARISAEGDLEIGAGEGSVTVTARDGVRVATPGDHVVAADRVVVSAARGEIVVGALAYVGDRVTAEVGRVKTVVKRMETIAERWVQRLDTAYRFVAKSESVRSEYLDYQARSAFHVRAETTLVNSSGLTKVDGSQIHLG